MMFDRFNRLTPAEDERLALLEEECAEVIQAIAKIRRHGYDSDNKGTLGRNNRMALEFELGHVQAAMALMLASDDVKGQEINYYRREKLESVWQWLHHNERPKPDDSPKVILQ